MAGSADGYRRIPKRLRVLYCFQFASVSSCTQSTFSHELCHCDSPVLLWIYGGGKRTFIFQTEDSNVARFSSLSIVPLLTAPKALKVGEGRGAMRERDYRQQVGIKLSYEQFSIPSCSELL